MVIVFNKNILACCFLGLFVMAFTLPVSAVEHRDKTSSHSTRYPSKTAKHSALPANSANTKKSGNRSASKHNNKPGVSDSIHKQQVMVKVKAKPVANEINTTVRKTKKVTNKKIKTTTHKAAKPIQKHNPSSPRRVKTAKTQLNQSNKKPVSDKAKTLATLKEPCVAQKKDPSQHCQTIRLTKSKNQNQNRKIAKVNAAGKTAMTKLMKQLGKPYHWGGASPRTGFDCSGLVYFAYKDLVKFSIPRTADEMYHLRDASPVPRSELRKGDLVFFRTEGRGTADHVGVYIGDGKFIQSPRSGQDVQIASLDLNYWQSHYVGARRLVTPETVR